MLNQNDYLVFVSGQKLVRDVDSDESLVGFDELSDYLSALLVDADLMEVDAYKKGKCYVVNTVQEVEEHRLLSFRTLLSAIGTEEGQLINRALQLITWNKGHQFCGQCGQKNQQHIEERALHCNDCGLFYYPRISPCMMCLITKDDYCLLAQHSRYANQYYSTLAGFVEAGENLEQTVRREVMEEVGLTVGELTYYSTQAWPFPHQLMIGYFAEYQSGDIQIDHDEIVDAQWFHYSELPGIPPTGTLSNMMITSFAKRRAGR